MSLGAHGNKESESESNKSVNVINIYDKSLYALYKMYAR